MRLRPHWKRRNALLYWCENNIRIESKSRYMADTQYNKPLFGLNVDPAVKNLQLAYKLAQLADSTGMDVLCIQDHPYNAAFLDTWTLLTFLGARTQRVRLLPNVANLPLRPPAI